MMNRNTRLLLFCLAMLLVAACRPNAAAPTPTVVDPAAQPKQLATVFLSPTPDEAQQQATRSASLPTFAPILPTAPPSPTVYIGVFLGDSQSDGGLPVFDPTRYVGTRVITVPTPEATPCPIPVDPSFGSVWSADSRLVRLLGCAGEPATPYVGASEIFERGVMYWLPTNEFFVIAPGGTTGGRYWYFDENPPDLPLDIVVPDGLRQPVSGFGMVWRAYAEIRDAIGFARAEERQANLALQRFAGGALLYDASSGQVFVILASGGQNPGIAYGPY